jgi:hypothetical protein
MVVVVPLAHRIRIEVERPHTGACCPVDIEANAVADMDCLRRLNTECPKGDLEDASIGLLDPTTAETTIASTAAPGPLPT